MRNFDERKEEIFRRSREKIKKRELRKKIYFTVIPCFVFSVIAALSFIVRLPSADGDELNSDPASFDTCTDEQKGDQLKDLPAEDAENHKTEMGEYVFIEYFEQNTAVSCAVSEQVDLFSELLTDITEIKTETEDIQLPEADETFTADNAYPPAAEAVETVTNITIFHSDGSKDCFVYQDNTLTDINTNRIYCLTIEEDQKLKRLLEIQKELIQ